MSQVFELVSDTPNQTNNAVEFAKNITKCNTCMKNICKCNTGFQLHAPCTETIAQDVTNLVQKQKQIFVTAHVGVHPRHQR